MPRKHLLSLLLHNGVDHPPGQQIPLHLAAENIGLASVQAVFSVLLIKKGQVQGAAVIHGPGLHHRAPAGNAAGHGIVCDHSPDAHRLPELQFPDGPGHGAVLVPPGKVADQVLQRSNAQLRQGLGPGLADTLYIAHIRLQISHVSHLTSCPAPPNPTGPPGWAAASGTAPWGGIPPAPAPLKTPAAQGARPAPAP